jgi:hypothetical protein
LSSVFANHLQTMDEVDFTILAATSVFTDFMDKCPPAEACRDAFDRTVKATLKMVNASGGFGQQYHPNQQASGASSSRNSLDHTRLDWSTRSDSTASLSGQPGHHSRRHPRNHHHPQPSTEQASPTTASEAYSHNPSLLSAFQKGAQYRLSGGPTTAAAIKTEPDAAAAFSHMRNLPVPPPPRSNASSADLATTPDAALAVSIDQQMMRSPSGMQQQMSSPVVEMGGFLASPRPQQQQQQGGQGRFSPGMTPFGEMQGMEFLQGLGNGNNGGGVGGGGGGPSPGGMGIGVGVGGPSPGGTGLDAIDFSGLADTQMDLGFGLGWEGLHHDFSDGQQLDLFDGFFFGGGQGGQGQGPGG